MRKKKKCGWAKWVERAVKPLIKTMEERQKTAKAKEKIHRKAVKRRKKKIERRVDGLLAGGYFLICLAAALMEAKE